MEPLFYSGRFCFVALLLDGHQESTGRTADPEIRPATLGLERAVCTALGLIVFGRLLRIDRTASAGVALYLLYFCFARIISEQRSESGAVAILAWHRLGRAPPGRHYARRGPHLSRAADLQKDSRRGASTNTARRTC